MKEQDEWLQFLIAGLLIGAMCSAIVTEILVTRKINRQTIQNGAGRYNPSTGEFEYFKFIEKSEIIKNNLDF